MSTAETESISCLDTQNAPPPTAGQVSGPSQSVVHLRSRINGNQPSSRRRARSGSSQQTKSSMISARDRILVVAPHADDELIGEGGSLLKWKELGAQIQVVLVACSDIDMIHTGSTVTGKVREAEFQSSCEALGDSDPIVLNKRDSCLDMEPISNLVSELDRIAASFEPTIFVYPEPSYHQDHQYVNRACTASIRPTKQVRPALILTYEIPTTT